MFQSRGKSCVCIYVYIAVGLMGWGCPRCLGLLQNSAESDARKVVGRGLWGCSCRLACTVSDKQACEPWSKNPFYFLMFFNFKISWAGSQRALDFRPDDSLILQHFIFHLLLGEENPITGLTIGLMALTICSQWLLHQQLWPAASHDVNELLTWKESPH